jgi:RNA polymerase sigma factor (sigma-70 family)
MQNTWSNLRRHDRARRRRPPAGLLSLGGAAQEEVGPDLADLPGKDPTPSRTARREEEQALVRAALDQLDDPVDRQVLRLRYLEERPLEAIAGQLGLSAHQVDYRCRKGLKQLRRLLERLQ